MAATAILLIGLFIHHPGQPVCQELENGLNLFILEDHTLPLVSVQLWFASGQAHDPPEKPGLTAIAHALLAARFDNESPASVPVSEVLYCDSEVLRDACFFASLTSPEYAEQILRRETRRLQPIEVTPPILEAALRRAAGLYAAIAAEPDQTTTRSIFAALFPNHPYQHPPGFVSETLRDLSPTELANHLKLRFTPTNATLFVIGDVSAERIEKLTRDCFESSRNNTEPPTSAPPNTTPPAPTYPRAPDETIRIPPGPTNEPALTVAWRTAPLGYFENAALDVLMERLCNPIDGPLCRRLLEIGCRPPTWQRWAAADAGMLTLTITRDVNHDSSAPASKQKLSRISSRISATEEPRASARPVPPSRERFEPKSSFAMQPRSPFAIPASECAPPEEPRASTRPVLTEKEIPTREKSPSTDIHADWETIASVIDEELARALAEVAGPIEHDRARASANRRILDLRRTFSHRACEIAESQMVAGDFALAAYAPARVAAVSVNDVRAAALTLQESRKVVSYPGITPNADPTSRPSLTTALASHKPLAAKPKSTHELPAEIAARRQFHVNDRVSATILLTPGRPLAEVRSVLIGENIPPRLCQTALDHGSALHTAAEIRDYLSYHGSDISVLDEAGLVGFISRGPAAKVFALAELQWELIARPADSVREDMTRVKNIEMSIAVDGDVEHLRREILDLWNAP